jgi:hypothetical protein
LKIDFKKTGEIIVIQWTIVDVTGQFIYAIGKDITEIRKLRKIYTSKKLLNDAQK